MPFYNLWVRNKGVTSCLYSLQTDYKKTTNGKTRGFLTVTVHHKTGNSGNKRKKVPPFPL